MSNTVSWSLIFSMGCSESKPAAAVNAPHKPVRNKYGGAASPESQPRELTADSSSNHQASHQAHRVNAFSTAQRELSAKKIQTLIRRRSSSNNIGIEREWKIFNDIDIQDEAQMLMLANFMQSLLDTNYAADSRKEEIAEQNLNISDIDMQTTSRLKMIPGLSVDSIDLDFEATNKRVSGAHLLNFMIPKGAISTATVSDIMDLYRLEGKLSPSSVQTILRQAYKFLKLEKNIHRMEVANDERVAIVGDLHGQIKDLLFILKENGVPSESNKYIFNGDFVDRGTSGVEVLLLLLSLYCAYPGYVSLNRGNHEDYPVCCVYGFQAECHSKYDEKFFGMFCELFNHLPICSIVNNTILVIHGGLFHDPNVLLEDIEAINRTEYKISIGAEEEFSLGQDCSRDDHLLWLFRDAMWSDPHSDDVVVPNTRGSGILFGPSHTRTFLDNNNLSMIVRSHECVRGGIAFPFLGKDKSLLCTVFSASNYGGSGNQAAFLVCTTHAMTNSKPIRNSDMHFSVQSFSTSHVNQASLLTKNRISLKEMLLRRKRALKLTFESKDVTMSGLVSFTEWAKQMADVTGLKILWIPLIKTIVPPDCIEGAYVKYDPFLASLSEGKESFESQTDVSSLYGPVEQLELIFKVFDKNGDGKISKSEFKLGCEHLNSTLPLESQFKDIDQLLKLIDLDGDECIDKNELFEVFRHLDGKDGVVDGIISMASKYSVTLSTDSGDDN